jgi:hypothetical protein
VILGLNSLLALPQKPQEIMQKMPELFKTAMMLVKKNAEERIDDEDMNGKGEKDSDDDEDDDLENYNFDSDDEDFWEEQYDDNYNSSLDQIDEIR